MFGFELKCEICGRLQLFSCCDGDLYEETRQRGDQLCVECRKAVGFAQEQRLREYVAKNHPEHTVRPLTDGANGEKRLWCEMCDSILSAPIRKSEPPPRPQIEIPSFTKFTPPNVKSS
jgi:hypothetical protein